MFHHSLERGTLVAARTLVPRFLKKASARDLTLGIIRVFASLYQIGFAIYLPASRYTSLPSPARYRWFALLAFAVLLDRGLAYVPKKSANLCQLIETERLRATGVATSRLNECARKRTMTDADFVEVAYGLLTAVRFNVQSFAADQTGQYINASLLVEDIQDTSKLKVVARAIPNRLNRTYAKQGILVWQAMVEERVVFESDFHQDGKPYHSILIIPLLVEASGIPRSVGAISVDSGRIGEFDSEAAESLEKQLYPYTTLLALLLGLQTAFRKESNGTSA